MNSQADLFLQTFPLLEPLAPPQRQALARVTTIVELTRGQRVYLAGDRSEYVFLLRLGVVRLVAAGPDGPLILAFVWPGDLFGESALADEAPRDHYAEVHADAIVCAVPREPLVRVLKATPAFSYHLARLMATRVRTYKLRLEELLHRGARTRLARSLLALARQFGSDVQNGVFIPVALNQGELASLVGLRRETVNVVLQDLRRRGLVETHKRGIRLKDPGALARLAADGREPGRAVDHPATAGRQQAAAMLRETETDPAATRIVAAIAPE